MRRTFVILLIVSIVGYSYGQPLKSVSGTYVPRPVCKASDEAKKSFIPPPSNFLLKSHEKKSDFIVEYVSFPVDAKAAFEHAVGIWESIIESDIPIHVRARWSTTMATGTLASCGPETYYANFKDAPFKDHYYAVAIAEKIANEELNGVSRFDIEATFSGKIKWYYGIDGDTDIDKYDFVSVALHEIAHGLGFTGFFFVDEDEDIGAYAYYEFGDLTPFDKLVENSQGKSLGNPSFFENASLQLKSALESGLLYSNSPIAKSSNSDQRPKLYAPSPFDEGSSVYHLNDNTYQTGDDNSLMTHALAPGEAIHDPGPLALGIIEDIGWTNLLLRHTGVKDKEQIEPLIFTVGVDSYYPLKDAAYVIYSTDNFNSVKDTLELQPTENENEYSVSLNPDAGTENIQYYLEISDIKNRIRTSPWNAPDVIHNVHFGTDNEKPVIQIDEVPYFLVKDEPLQLEANVDDNLGIDTVYVTYAINDIEQSSFGLTLESGTRYSGFFNFNLETLADGDIITYTITAIDASGNKNTTIYPSDNTLQFRIERIFDPVTNYTTDFKEDNVDFILYDFDIYTATNFTDGALHSPHPYESPNSDNKELNFTTLLKYPIIIQEGGDMAFDEVVLVEPGESQSVYGDDDFWDYVILEGSKDFGETWYKLANGYDSGDNATWEQNYKDGIPLNGQDSETEGTAEWYVTRNISLLESGNFSVGDTILIRFRLYSDPYASGWGWAIDNLRIQKMVSAPLTTLSPGNVNVYPNPFNNHFELEISPKKALNDIQIELFDMYGRSLFVRNEQNVSSFKETIDMQKYSSGLFLLKVSENGRPVVSKKIIKN